MSPQIKPPELDRERGRHLLHQMLRIRRFEEKCYELYGAMKIRGFLHLYDGEEAVAVGVMEALREEDAVVATYREHGQALAKGMDMNAIMAELFGKQEGCARGRGGSMHLFDAKSRFYGGNAIVGGGLPVAVGMALANKMQGKDEVTVCFFGDGAAAEGEFHEALNLAALWQVPILFLCENNQYAMGTALRYSHAVTTIADKAANYGIPAQPVDGMDVLAVAAAAHEATARIRAGEGPQFIEAITYRFRAHSMFDAELYRSREEVARWKERDPIRLFTDLLLEQKLITADDIEALEHEVTAEVDTSVQFAEAGTWEPVTDLERFVYSERRVS
jgi:pyruvate dehydrogenase E1 component alpha subunit